MLSSSAGAFGAGRVRRVDRDGIITTVAGGGSQAAAGDDDQDAIPDDPLTAAIGVRGVSLDRAGNLYIADYTFNRIRMVEAATGLLRTLAGDGLPLSSGDGGPARAAQVEHPLDVLWSPDGTLYLSQAGGARLRAIRPDGTIVAIALGQSFFASAALALGPDGSLYVTGGYNRVWRLDPEGKKVPAAGTGTPGNGGDGGAATAATLWDATGVDVCRDGSLYVVDQVFDRVRRVGPDGIIRAFAGVFTTDPNDPGGFSGDLGPATLAKLKSPRRVKCAPDGSVYIADTVNNRIRRVVSPLPGYAGVGDLVIGAESGSELLVFDADGKHQQTIDALTGAVRYAFDYDLATGELSGITDREGRVTEISRSASTVTIKAPDEQETALTLNTDGYVARIESPAGASTFSTTADGLMTNTTDPNGHARTFTYEGDGRLRVAHDPPGAGGSDTLVRTDLVVPDGAGYQVTHTTTDGVATTYQVAVLDTGEERRTTRNPDGTQDETLIGQDGSRTVTRGDGTVTTTAIGPDPRFGMQAPVTTNATVTTPDAITATVTASRQAPGLTAGDPLSFDTLTDTVVVNNRPPATSTYTAARRVTTDTTPAGRQTQTTVDAKGRVTRVQAADLHPLRLTYDPVTGQPTEMKYGPENPDADATRRSVVSYVDDIAIVVDGYPPAAKGQMKTSTDPGGRITTFEYYPTGRVKAQVLPGNRRVEFQYDAAGNVTSITPPGRPAHGFTYTPVNLEQSYVPPPLSPAGETTTYTYTVDRQLDLVERPDDKQIDYVYDTAGRLDTLKLLAGGIVDEEHDYVYDDPGGPGEETGNLAQIVAPDATLEFSYDGSLPTGEAWSGPGLTGASVTKTYDTSLRLLTQQIAVGTTTEPAITFQYDNDDLLTQAGALTLTPDSANGLLRGTSITAVDGPTTGTVVDATDYAPAGQTVHFGEVYHYEAKHRDVQLIETELFDATYERDDLGRITRITETVTVPPAPPEPTDRYYKYDPAGRLWRVCPDDACTTVQAEYLYDANGNRLAGTVTAQGTVTSATYDHQDRLTSITVGPTVTNYEYTDNGELWRKTEGTAVTTYAYGALGNLRRVDLPDGTSIDYVVDGLNRRIGKKVDGILVRLWIYQDQLKPVAELDGQGNLLAEFVYASNPHVPDYMNKGGQTYRLLSDHLGSVRLVVNVANNTVAQRIDYDEFGNVLTDTAPGLQPFGFAGGIFDCNDPSAPYPGTGLARFGARDYDADTGRWTAKDPILFEGRSANLYGYVRTDPVNRTDAGGTQDFAIGGQLGAIATAGVLAGIHAIGVSASICAWTAAATAAGLDIDVPTLFNACKVDESECDRQYYKVDIPTCRAIGRSRGPIAAQRCYASAAERYAACLAGRPLPPLDTWNN